MFETDRLPQPKEYIIAKHLPNDGSCGMLGHYRIAVRDSDNNVAGFSSWQEYSEMLQYATSGAGFKPNDYEEFRTEFVNMALKYYSSWKKPLQRAVNQASSFTSGYNIIFQTSGSVQESYDYDFVDCNPILYSDIGVHFQLLFDTDEQRSLWRLSQ